MNKILFFKSEENSKDYTEIFEKNGFKIIFIPVLIFKYVSLELLLNKLENYNEYDGIVITSQRSIEAVVKCVEGNKDIMNKWKHKSIFVVGTKTYNKLFCDLSLKGIGEKTGNATALADLIVQQNNEDKFVKPLLFPCGNLKSEILPQKMEDNNIKIDPTVVYLTEEDKMLKEKLIHLQQSEGIPVNLVFFSPSGVNFIFPILKEIGYDLNECNLIAIGPSTEKKILEFGCNVMATAKEPTSNGIFSCFKLK